MVFLRTFQRYIRRIMPYYAVRQGRNAGIYSDWDSCREQVNGFRGAQFKKFTSEEEAERFIAGDNTGTGYGRQRSYQASYSPDYENDYSSSYHNSGYTNSYADSSYGNQSYSNHSNRGSRHQSHRYHPYSGGSSSSYSSGSSSTLNTGGDLDSAVISLRNGISKLASQVKVLNQQINRIEQNKIQQRTTRHTVPHTVRHYSTDVSSNGHDNGSGTSSTTRHCEVYTDGCCIDNGRGDAKAGIGVYWGNNHPRNVAERLPGRQTNNRAEIHAARKAINQAKEMGMDSLTVKTDSQFLINSVTKWMPNWKRNGWKLSNKEPVKNRHDFEELDRDMQGISVKWVHVRGHQGIHGNEQADRLANDGAAKPQS